MQIDSVVITHSDVITHKVNYYVNATVDRICVDGAS